MESFCQKIVELLTDANLGVMLSQELEQLFCVRRLFGLINVSEYGKFHMTGLLLALQRCYFFIIFLYTYDYYLYFCPKLALEL